MHPLEQTLTVATVLALSPWYEASHSDASTFVVRCAAPLLRPVSSFGVMILANVRCIDLKRTLNPLRAPHYSNVFFLCSSPPIQDSELRRFPRSLRICGLRVPYPGWQSLLLRGCSRGRGLPFETPCGRIADPVDLLHGFRAVSGFG